LEKSAARRLINDAPDFFFHMNPDRVAMAKPNCCRNSCPHSVWRSTMIEAVRWITEEIVAVLFSFLYLIK